MILDCLSAVISKCVNKQQVVTAMEVVKISAGTCDQLPLYCWHFCRIFTQVIQCKAARGQYCLPMENGTEKQTGTKPVYTVYRRKIVQNSCQVLLLFLIDRFLQTSTPVTLTIAAVLFSFARSPYSFSFRGLFSGHVSPLRLLCRGQCWKKCSVVMGAVSWTHL